MIKKVLKKIGIVVSVIALVVVAFIGALTITEYNPSDTLDLDINGSATNTVSIGDTLKIITWNMGYGALSENADFFMDGGTSVMTASKDQVLENTNAIISTIDEENADIVFLQEVDTKSKRSHKVNEVEMITNHFNNYQNSYAYNYKCLYVPYPLPTIGTVNSGILTLSNISMNSSVRQKLPCPFSWPVSVANLKRCLLISRSSIEGTDKELVYINLHLEAYDSGEGKEKQTKLLKSILESEVEKGNYVIAGGDFNQVFSSYDTSDYPLISEDLWQPGSIDTDAFSSDLQFEADTSFPTCRSLDKAYKDADKDNFQYYMLDGFIVSSNLQVEEVKTINKDFKNTDHNPVSIKVTLK